MGSREEGQTFDRLFTLAEANSLLPQLEDCMEAVQRGKAILMRTKKEIARASANASFGGGSPSGPHYIGALEQVGRHLHTVQEMGVLVKDIDIGLCDFPFMKDGRVVYLCWKLGEPDVRWWHEIDSGYSARQAIDCL